MRYIIAAALLLTLASGAMAAGHVSDSAAIPVTVTLSEVSWITWTTGDLDFVFTGNAETITKNPTFSCDASFPYNLKAVWTDPGAASNFAFAGTWFDSVTDINLVMPYAGPIVNAPVNLTCTYDGNLSSAANGTATGSLDLQIWTR
jgi:hypothetical protein